MPRKPKAPKEFNDFLAFLHLFLPYRAIEGVLRALERLKIIKPRLLNNMGKSKKHGHKIPRGK